MNDKCYHVSRAEKPPELQGSWDGNAWRNVPALEVSAFRPEGSAHRPRTDCKLLYDAEAIYAIFRVQDYYVRCVHAGFQADVYKDSCVELFLKPQAGSGYFNFEFNCGGSLLASYVTDPTRVGGRVKECVLLGVEDDAQIRRFHSLPAAVEPEIAEELVWYLECVIPFIVMEKYTGPFGQVSGQTWHGNVYKCGNETSHPHWGAWSAVHELNFHLPECFGEFYFDPDKKDLL